MAEYLTLLLVVAAFSAGYLSACWRVARKTGETLRRVVIQGGGPTNPTGPV